MAITSAFQADDTGSIPVTRSRKSREGHLSPQLRYFLQTPTIVGLFQKNLVSSKSAPSLDFLWEWRLAEENP